MSSLPKSFLSADEYLAFERQSIAKHEYYAGEIFAMVGASREHNLIVSALIRLLGNQLLARPCNVYPSDMRVKVDRKGKYTYPDVMIACGEEHFDDEHNDTLLNPVVIIEVLSESTEAYDRGRKFEHYQYIDSLTDYLLVAQEPYRVEHYARQSDKQWLYQEFHHEEDTVRIDSIDCTLLLADVYAKVL